MVAGFHGNWFLNFYVEDFFLKTPGLERHFVGGASINESTPGVNHPGVGIYLNPPVEIVAGATREDAADNLQPSTSSPARPRCLRRVGYTASERA
jgi:hypothetical protein